MASATSDSGNQSAIKDEKLRLYAIVAIVLIALAIISTLLVSHSPGAGQCGGFFKQQSYSCIEQLAYSTSNSSMCASLPTAYADQCYGTIAENTMSSGTCMKISDPNLSGECTVYVANKTGNSAMCNSLSPNFEQVCVDQIAVNLKRPGSCIQIANNTARSICISAVYIENAFSSLNKSDCRMIASDNSSEVTYAALGLVSANSSGYYNLSQSLSYAELSNVTIGARDACYMGLAFSLMNRSYCSYASSNAGSICNLSIEQANSSYYNATPSNFTSFMNLCTQQESISECNDTMKYLQAATAKNLTSCENLTSIYAYQCYDTLSQKYDNAKYCSYITNMTLNADCVSAVKGGGYSAIENGTN